MIKAELNYNPYLMEINVSFNGQSPHINSLIEKYQEQPLQDWISLLPQIYHDEMNGYYFELDFSGTELDYNEVVSAFRSAGVSEDEVMIFLKNKLDPREQKLEDINKLLDWLDNNRNKYLDIEEFRRKNHDLFDENYTYVIIHGNPEDVNIKDVSFECVDSVNELDCTDLTHTPILYYISKDVLPQLASDLLYIIDREDINDNQLFFYISKDLKKNKVKRVIVDLGITAPKIVNNIYDESIHRYSLLYPISDYIYSSIKAFRTETDRVSAILNEQNKKSELQGKEIHTRLYTIEKNIERIKEADEKIVSRDNILFPAEFKSLKENLISSLMNWRIKKTKINKPEEAFAAASEFDSFIRTSYNEFCVQLDNASRQKAGDILDLYLAWYRSAHIDESFIDNVTFLPSKDYPSVAEQAYELLKLKEEKYVTQSSSRIGRLFKSSDADNNQPVLETTYYYQTWREHLSKMINPIIEELAKDRFALLEDYSKKLADVYHLHLTELLNKQIEAKNETSSQLSEDEKLLQIDNDWLTAFTDQLKNIERS